MKWTVGAKIGSGFALALLILLIIGTVAYQSSKKLVETSERVAHTHEVMDNLTALLNSLTDAETGQRGFIITGTEAYLEPYRNGLPEIDRKLQDLKHLVRDNDQQKNRLTTLEPIIKQRLALLEAGITTQRAEGFEAAKKFMLLGDGKKEMDDIRRIVRTMRDEEEDLLKKRTVVAGDSVEKANTAIIGGTALAFVVLALFAFLLTRNIAGPLQQITGVAERMAEGELGVRIAIANREDEVGMLAQTFDRMTQSLRGMADVAKKIADGDLRVQVTPQSERDMLGNAFALMIENLQKLTRQVAEGVNVLGASTNQISTSTTQLASGATETAVAVTETSTTVEEVRQTAQVATQKAKLVSDSAQQVAQAAQAGQRSTETTLEAMQRIRQQMESIAESMTRLSEQTQAIGQIIATVDDLAAQSNLLAVNAAIEAAKAGDQGKGFGVVAQEVRSLAEQSKQATGQVRAILNDIQKATTAAVMATEQGAKAVEFGVKQSSEAGQSIQVLSASVNEAAQAATQIAASSQQQLVGVDQVASAMGSIKQASAQNADSARQLQTAAHNLKELGQKLELAIKRYKV